MIALAITLSLTACCALAALWFAKHQQPRHPHTRVTRAEYAKLRERDVLPLTPDESAYHITTIHHFGRRRLP
jgi:hypothetical protein